MTPWYDCALIGVAAGMLSSNATQAWRQRDRGGAIVYGAIAAYLLWLSVRGAFLALR